MNSKCVPLCSQKVGDNWKSIVNKTFNIHELFRAHLGLHILVVHRRRSPQIIKTSIYPFTKLSNLLKIRKSQLALALLVKVWWWCRSIQYST